MADYDARKEAEDFLRNGVVSVAAAFNLADCRAWRFDKATCERADSLIQELVQLFHDNETTVDPALAAARSDDKLQFLIRQAMVKVEYFPDSIERDRTQRKRKAARK